MARLIASAPARGITVLTASVLDERGQIVQALRRLPGEFSLVNRGLTLEYP